MPKRPGQRGRESLLGPEGSTVFWICNLANPEFATAMVVQMDASETGAGAVLLQLQRGEEHPVIYSILAGC